MQPNTNPIARIGVMRDKRHAVSGDRESKGKTMHKSNEYQNESMAYALAAGMIILEDRDGEKLRRRQRYERKRARRGDR